MIAINKSNSGFHPNWKNYLLKQGIPFKEVNCYDNDLVEKLKGCTALMWHHSQNDPRDLNIAKQILFMAEHAGLVVFPNFNTNWHFDDKLGQKYLFELLSLPSVKSYAFYDKKKAIEFINNTLFPIVFKLRGGAGSFNVKLVKSKNEALKLVYKTFQNGFTNFDSIENLKEIIRKIKIKKATYFDLFKSIYRLFTKPAFAKVMGNEVGYIYFQEFIPDNSFDLRTIVIGKKAFAIKRNVRENDFRASGSGNIEYDKANFSDELIKLSFESAKKLKTQCVAFDFVSKNNQLLIIEISYGFLKEGYHQCVGYWDEELNFYEGNFDPCEWMVDVVMEELKKKSENDCGK
jgi:glutathione synthase/RimK-type ligase-like ATP-grasp enzyme